MSGLNETRERLRALPGMDRLLPQLDGLPPVYLVGGAVRDLLRGETAVDLDLAVEGDVGEVARALAERLAGGTRLHERFSTATVDAPGLVFDLVATRRERYPEPGALPAVEPAPLVDDLARRDFTVNAMALSLAGDQLGRLHDPHGGADDLAAGIVRVLHDASFVDDPTRLLRAVRYESRLGGALDEESERLARAAVEDGALDTVSGPRVRDELLDLLRELESPSALRRLAELRIDRGLHPDLRTDVEVAPAAVLGSLETGADPALAALAALATRAPEALREFVESLQLPASERDAVIVAASVAPTVARSLRQAERGSEIDALLNGLPPEALAVALALQAPPAPILRWVGDLRDVRLEVGGDDLLAAGVPEGPAIGDALSEVRRRKLDGEVRGRDKELALALELARGAAE
jgi:tRNA nucleotidyltransferase (CCA-adding enzyme)